MGLPFAKEAPEGLPGGTSRPVRFGGQHCWHPRRPFFEGLVIGLVEIERGRVGRPGSPVEGAARARGGCTCDRGGVGLESWEGIGYDGRVWTLINVISLMNRSFPEPFIPVRDQVEML